MTDFTAEMADRMRELLTRFKLPTRRAQAPAPDRRGHYDALPALLDVFETEAGERAHRRTERLLKYCTRLPARHSRPRALRLPRPVFAKPDELATGGIPRPRRQRPLLRLPGSDHAAAALGHALVKRGRLCLHACLPTRAEGWRRRVALGATACCAPAAPRRLRAAGSSTTSARQQSADEVEEVLYPDGRALRARRSLLITSKLDLRRVGPDLQEGPSPPPPTGWCIIWSSWNSEAVASAPTRPRSAPSPLRPTLEHPGRQLRRPPPTRRQLPWVELFHQSPILPAYMTNPPPRLREEAVARLQEKRRRSLDAEQPRHVRSVRGDGRVQQHVAPQAPVEWAPSQGARECIASR